MTWPPWVVAGVVGVVVALGIYLAVAAVLYWRDVRRLKR